MVVVCERGLNIMKCKVYDFNKQNTDDKENKRKVKHVDKRKLMIRIVAIGCTALIFGTFCLSLFLR